MCGGSVEHLLNPPISALVGRSSSWLKPDVIITKSALTPAIVTLVMARRIAPTRSANMVSFVRDSRSSGTDPWTACWQPDLTRFGPGLRTCVALRQSPHRARTDTIVSLASMGVIE